MTATSGVLLDEYISRAESVRRSPIRKMNRITEQRSALNDWETEMRGGTVIYLDHVDDLYELDLNGNRIDVPDCETISPMCPLCNNEMWEEIDHLIMGGASVREVMEYCGPAVTEQDVINHQVRHILPVAQAVLEEFFPSLLSEAALEPTKGFKKQLSKIEEAAKDIEGFTTSGEAAAMRRFVDEYDRVEKRRKSGKVAFLGKEGYAVQGERTHPVRIWSARRMEAELEKREGNAVTFIGELMNVRKMSYHVYQEIMNNGDPKLYGTAIAAVREIRGVVETMGKFSLIAKQIGDSGGLKKKLSPQMSDMIAKLGISVETNEENPAGGIDELTDDATTDFLRDIDDKGMRTVSGDDNDED